MNKKIKKILNILIIYSSLSYSIKKQIFFAKKLAFLIKAEVPILESFNILKEQSKNKNEIKIFQKIIEDINNGHNLSKSLSNFKKIFGNFTINLIKAGENSGSLYENLNYLADELNKKEKLRKKIIGAMVYPIIIIITTIIITTFLTLNIFPKIIPLFKSANIELPLSTKLIINIINLFRESGILIISIIVIIIISIVLSITYIKKINIIFNKLLLKIPIFGTMIKNYNITNTMRTLGLLLKSNIPLNESLIITMETTENILYKNAFLEMSINSTKGKRISEIINKYKNIFPIMSSYMVAIGEKTGNLSNSLIYLSSFYESEFENQTKNLSNTIEPLLMIIMGIAIGFIAISIISPIYEITNNIHQ